MFQYAIEPTRQKRRTPLHRFLMISVATLAESKEKEPANGTNQRSPRSSR